MQIQFISEMLNIPELQIRQFLSVNTDEVHIEAVPVDSKQCCPICQSYEAVVLKGRNGIRCVRHLPHLRKKWFIWYRVSACIVPTVRLVLFGCMNLWVPKNGTATSFENELSSKHLAPRQPIVPGCNRLQPAPFSRFTTKRSHLKVNGCLNKRGRKRKQAAVLSLVSMISR